MISHGLPEFSFYQTGISQEPFDGSCWIDPIEGQQYFSEAPSRGDQAGFAETSQESSGSHLHPLGSGLGIDQMSRNFSSRRWPDANDAAQSQAAKMTRWASQESSSGQISQGLNDTEQAQSVMLQSSSSQMSFPISSNKSDVTDFSTSMSENGMYAPSHDNFGYQAYTGFSPRENEDTFLNIDALDDGSMNQASQGSMPVLPSAYAHSEAMMNYTSMPESPATSMSEMAISRPASHGGNLFSNYRWDGASTYAESQTSPPGLIEDSWTGVTPLALSTDTSSNHSPNLHAYSPRYVILGGSMANRRNTHGALHYRISRSKPMALRMARASDDARGPVKLEHTSPNGVHDDITDEMITGPRASPDIDNTARDHPLYQKAIADAEGLYHCPWEGQSNCSHKPEKLKCNYE
jgi:hypothetical protein